MTLHGSFARHAPGASALIALAAGASSAAALEIKSSDVHPMDYPTTQAIAYMGWRISSASFRTGCSSWRDGIAGAMIWYGISLARPPGSNLIRSSTT